jgi:aminoglycoside phosphotransferase (APT) family kinase protein
MSSNPSTQAAGIDYAGAVRSGEELDVAAVTGWLRGQGLNLSDTPNVTQYSGGASNWTYP